MKDMLVNFFVDNVFTDDGQATRLSGRVLALISVSEPLFGLSILMQGILEGMGETLTKRK
ncbi:hypothetical protein AALC75_00005 [Lachnospiraceae bacterium 48-42]|jgi:hypothetical protein